jgi:monovalent cation:H+ antiporter-2, CPA2 family
MNDVSTLSDLLPVVVLLFLGISTAILSRQIRVSPIVGYIALGIALRASNVPIPFQNSTVATLAELGVVFLLFDVGLHFSLKQIRQRAQDIFAFGPVQVLFATLALGALSHVLGLDWGSAALVGVVLSMSSTAVVAGLIAERHQQGCPVGQTATAILIFQDVAAIIVLIIAGSLGTSQAITTVAALAMGKAIVAFCATVVIARIVIGPLQDLVARSRNEEVFTATALLIALAAGWATGQIGLSLTLGGFLGGVSLAESPYRAVIHSEISPFRGLLLGFFFVYVGLSLDSSFLFHNWYVIMAVTALLVGVKILTNMAASRVFHWSVPGSTQLGFLLAQGSEFGFVIFSLPGVRALLGEVASSTLVAAIALSLAVTPSLAEVGRTMAGRMRERLNRAADPELIPRAATAPVIIVGMGEIGRTVADALTEFDIEYFAVERDQRRLQEAIADGYHVSFGDSTDPRLWSSVEMQERKLSVLTAPKLDFLKTTSAVMGSNFPQLKRIAAVSTDAERAVLEAIKIHAVIERGQPRGTDLAVAALEQLGRTPTEIADWTRRVASARGLMPQEV